ncbi:MAG TPA: hemerythrin domain-containing protein [Iamia sp.]|jgi:iron-sulfur cluster repair protein YtfE (RIC family)|nr:hemerythrin domain-containing protein [Iamia sp.]
MADVLDHLIEEHRKVEQLLARLKESEPGSERHGLFDELRSSLATHMAVEERFVYPLMAEHLGEDESADATDEHELARAGLAEAAKRLEEGAFEAAIDILEAGIGHHVEEEESDQFPALREKAGPQLAAMDPDELEAAVEGGDDGGETRDELYQEAKEAGIEGRSKMDKQELTEALGKT